MRAHCVRLVSMATTLTVKMIGPSRVQLCYSSTEAGYAYLRRTGAVGANEIDLSSLAAGPLRACLARSANWSTLTDRVILRLTVEGAFGSSSSQTLPVYEGASAVGMYAIWLPSVVEFKIPISAYGVATFELQYIPSNQR